MQEIRGSQLRRTLMPQKNGQPDMQKAKKMCSNEVRVQMQIRRPSPHIILGSKRRPGNGERGRRADA
jgi:hypothetical protein